MKHRYRILPLFAAAMGLLSQNCAIRKGPPEGGAKDETPPKVVSEHPLNGSVNFNNKRIEISFDEYVELNNAFKEIQVTPSTGKAPILSLSKRSLYIDTAGLRLQPNTTYTIQFGNGIKDINEGNILLGYQYIFSTGSYIDSLYIDGNIVTVDPSQKLEKVRMQVYSEGNDTGLYKGRPAYMTMAEESGYFKIANLPKGRFRLYALEDKNENYILDPGERVGFIPGILQVDTGLRLPEPMVIFPAQPLALKVTHVSASQAQLRMKANMPVDTATVRNSNGLTVAGYPSWNTHHDSLVYWFATPKLADETVDISAYSSDYEAHASTGIIINPKDTTKRMYMVMDQAPENPVKFNTPLVLRFTEPVAAIDYRKVYFVSEDSMPLSGGKLKFIDSSHMNLGLAYGFEEDKKYRLSLGIGAFTSIRGRIQDTSSGLFSAPSRRDFGLLEVNITVDGAFAPYLFEVVNPSGNPIFSKRIMGADKVVLPYVPAGAYKLRLIRDENRNGRWDTGDIGKGMQPEPIYYYPQDVTVRANWEMAGILFDLTTPIRH